MFESEQGTTNMQYPEFNTKTILTLAKQIAANKVRKGIIDASEKDKEIARQVEIITRRELS